ncbi:hypothetical protein BB558_003211 [Smittium angustum]|uniref:Peroxin-7 n=1 Tax=Smittium angustum TaxID=133377 RepID=A0A2U1J6P6_SMIAN|nr:hypothetical protein BB558_003211 [Smittium angustum]
MGNNQSRNTHSKENQNQNFKQSSKKYDYHKRYSYDPSYTKFSNTNKNTSNVETSNTQNYTNNQFNHSEDTCNSDATFKQNKSSFSLMDMFQEFEINNSDETLSEAVCKVSPKSRYSFNLEENVFNSYKKTNRSYSDYNITRNSTQFESFGQDISSNQLSSIKDYIYSFSLVLNPFSKEEDDVILTNDQLRERVKIFREKVNLSFDTILKSQNSLFESKNVTSSAAYKFFKKVLDINISLEKEYNQLASQKNLSQQEKPTYNLMQSITEDLKFLKSFLPIYQDIYHGTQSINYQKPILDRMWSIKLLAKSKTRLSIQSTRSRSSLLKKLSNTSLKNRKSNSYIAKNTISGKESFPVLDQHLANRIGSIESIQNKTNRKMASRDYKKSTLRYDSPIHLRKKKSHQSAKSVLSSVEDKRFVNEIQLQNINNSKIEHLKVNQSPLVTTNPASSMGKLPMNNFENLTKKVNLNRVIFSKNGFVPVSHLSYQNDQYTPAKNLRGDLSLSKLHGRIRSRSLINDSFSPEKNVLVTCRTQSMVGSPHMTLVPNFEYTNPSKQLSDSLTRKTEKKTKANSPRYLNNNIENIEYGNNCTECYMGYVHPNCKNANGHIHAINNHHSNYHREDLLWSELANQRKRSNVRVEGRRRTYTFDSPRTPVLNEDSYELTHSYLYSPRNSRKNNYGGLGIEKRMERIAESISESVESIRKFSHKDIVPPRINTDLADDTTFKNSKYLDTDQVTTNTLEFRDSWEGCLNNASGLNIKNITIDYLENNHVDCDNIQKPSISNGSTLGSIINSEVRYARPISTSSSKSELSDETTINTTHNETKINEDLANGYSYRRELDTDDEYLLMAKMQEKERMAKLSEIVCKKERFGLLDSRDILQVKFSPFRNNIIATGGAANFGLIGNGQVGVYGFGPDMILKNVKKYNTQTSVYDIAWNEAHESQLVSACVDGSLSLWDINVPDFPISKWKEHTKEVMSVKWNYISKDCFISASWDSSIKLWKPHMKMAAATILGHQGCIYDVVWSPNNNNMFASCSEDKTIKLHNLSNPNIPVMTLQGHRDQVLSIDWNKYNQNNIVSTSSDKSVKLWDIRNPKYATMQLGPFEFPFKKVICSPHHHNVIALCGYDMNVSIWSLDTMRPMFVHEPHTEFVFGMDWSLFNKNLMVSYAWDEQVHLFEANGISP